MSHKKDENYPICKLHNRFAIASKKSIYKQVIDDYAIQTQLQHRALHQISNPLGSGKTYLHRKAQKLVHHLVCRVNHDDKIEFSLVA